MLFTACATGRGASARALALICCNLTLAQTTLRAAPDGEKAPADAAVTHWAFRPIAHLAPPATRDAGWARDDLDRFILVRLEAAGLAPNPDADRTTLIRRIAFDLTGLPPTPEEVDAFVADRADDDAALAKVVDAYLKSPRFGERWGRHWLDVARYADSVGRSWNAPFPYAWRYRDWVIDALNADLPYDRFIAEQLAGDLLPADSPEQGRRQRIATGFLAVGSVPLQEGSREQFVLDRVDDQVDVTTRGFLGLTVSCARCHDHKYDPVSIQDYYALAGVFYSTQTWSGQGYLTHEERRLDYVDGDLLVRLPPLLGGPKYIPKPGDVHSMSDFRVAWQQDRMGVRYAYDPDRAMGVAEGRVRDCEVRLKGIPNDRGDAPPRLAMKVPGLPEPPKVPSAASGRLELARWITSADHPLTARVMTNRVWLHLFGRGVVGTPDDFGFTGEQPTHPELLDHLAARFAADWSVKKLVRSVVLSRTYRQSAAGRKDGREKDPQNELYWRSNPRRLEAEAIRDSLLAAAGRLALERPEGIQVSGTGGKGRGSATYSLLGIDAPYRTVYLPVLRSLLPEFHTTFDFPDPSQIMGRREVTTVPPQALFFLNSDFVTDCARRAAGLLLKEPDLSDAERIRLAYRRILSRPPTADEAKETLDLLRGLGTASTEESRWATLTQALMAGAEFRYVR